MMGGGGGGSSGENTSQFLQFLQWWEVSDWEAFFAWWAEQ
jgi:hypothetical protein